MTTARPKVIRPAAIITNNERQLRGGALASAAWLSFCDWSLVLGSREQGCCVRLGRMSDCARVPLWVLAGFTAGGRAGWKSEMLGLGKTYLGDHSWGIRSMFSRRRWAALWAIKVPAYFSAIARSSPWARSGPNWLAQSATLSTAIS